LVGDVHGLPLALDHRANRVSLEDKTFVVECDHVCACAHSTTEPPEDARLRPCAHGTSKATETVE
jgi:hypothetical protein